MSEKKQVKKLLFEHPTFDVVSIDEYVGIQGKTMTVAVLPYSVDEHSIIQSIGLLREPNPFRAEQYADTLITGTVEYEDDSLLLAAIRELKEESGYAVEDRERWLFLGTLYLYKDSDKMIPVFAVDVTSIEPGAVEGDGSKKEANAKLHMTDVREGIACDESLVLSSFLRLFNYMYAKSMKYV